jgi:carbon monoxide dehydrogenase subunit G
MLKKILVVIVAIIAIVLIWAAFRPNELLVQRTATINAPPEKIFPLLNDFHAWGSWSPWEKLDPAMKRTYSGPASGQGAVYAWEGNRDVGSGRMELVESTPPSKVGIKLDFLKPFEAHNHTEFTLAPNGNATNVTWTMRGPSPYMTKLMGIFFNMDKMVGSDFERGLANLKAVAEK